MHMPLVSIIMPVLNAERYLRGAVDSILSQTFTDFEFVIIDNGSVDRSLEVINSYTDPRIRVLRELQRGIVPALNKGLMEAQGRYIARMDADDISDPLRLQRQVSYMEAHPQTCLLGSWTRIINEDGSDSGQIVTPPVDSTSLCRALYAKNVMVHGSVMMKRTVAVEIGGYRAGCAPAEDYELWLRLLEVGHVANIPEPLYQLRLHPASTLARTQQWTIERQVARAQRAAFYRYLTGSHKPQLPTSNVTLREWIELLLEQGHLLLATYALSICILSRRPATEVGPIIRANFSGRTGLRTLSRGSRRTACVSLLIVNAAYCSFRRTWDRGS